ncbi:MULTISPECIES: hypothetical protein [Zooshikella]|uniref:Uncharacterized protein n=1 Tax=Zooshikella ganghwensis TaxID=202772 RepID=A0A4P9VE49_9GAMM|nr:hypothetical protein [Zooshikella ganghwensis]RDH41338.1 hypothetical protein B9G39_29145 [Zooshikella ganghwensis]
MKNNLEPTQIIDGLKDYLGLKNDAALASALNINQNSITQYKRTTGGTIQNKMLQLLLSNATKPLVVDECNIKTTSGIKLKVQLLQTQRFDNKYTQSLLVTGSDFYAQSYHPELCISKIGQEILLFLDCIRLSVHPNCTDALQELLSLMEK